MKFSERYGYSTVRDSIQRESLDLELRNALWSLLKLFYWDKVKWISGAFGGSYRLTSEENTHLRVLCQRLWFSLFKEPLDTLGDDFKKVSQKLRDHFFAADWYEVYDFIEFVAKNFPDENTNKKFMDACNDILEKEVSAYRFVSGQVTEIVTNEEIEEIEQAIDSDDQLIAKHLQRSLQLLSDKKNPDYRNSVKESISAVERLAQHVVGDDGASLGDLLKRVEKVVELHGALRSAFSSLYGFSSDASGIRHALTDKQEIDFEDAKFMLVVCSAFINYVNGKIRSST